MKIIGIIDYGAGNLDSVTRATEECGGRPRLVRSRSDLAAVESLILPGVGSFSVGMKNLHESDLVGAIKEAVIERSVPLLGVCLGMQLLASRGYEGGETDGLDLIKGEVLRLEPQAEGDRIPHVGWNSVHPLRDSTLLAGIAADRDFYFVHSYRFVCQDASDVIAKTSYCGEFVSIVGRGSVFGVQFHPEKSQKCGLSLLRNFFQI